MFPNFHDQEYLLTDKITYRLNEPKRGDVIIFRAPKNEEYDYIKRIIGLPGDMVRVSDCHIYVNGQLLKESYLEEKVCTSGGHLWQEGQNIPVPNNQYFVSGDNRQYSSDSRDWGPVPKENIVGKAWYRYWPVGTIGIIRRVDY